MIERLVRTCGQIGLITNNPDSGSRIGPPAESEYAVEPVGVATIKPSALNSVRASPFTRVRNRIKRDNSPRLKTASFSAIIGFCCELESRSVTSSSARLLNVICPFPMQSTASRDDCEPAHVKKPSEP